MSEEIVSVDVLVEGGKATAGPPLAPALGPTGVNLFQVVQEINKKTMDFQGLKVPVTVKVNKKDKSFEVIVGVPPTSALIIKESGASKGSSNPNKDFVGDLPLEKVISIAKIKQEQMLANDLKGATKEVLGTMVSMGITCNGIPAKEMIKKIDAGEFDSMFE